jgi:Putative lumazine-binding
VSRHAFARCTALIVAATFAGLHGLLAQGPPAPPALDARYYDFWEGTWYAVRDGVRRTTAAFSVTPAAGRRAWREEWFTDAGQPRATALRAWDDVAKQWTHTWIGVDGLHQQWLGQKSDDGWYMYRRFNLNGDKYLSRQALLPVGADRVRWVSDKSYDDGRTWQPRFRFELVRGSPRFAGNVDEQAVREIAAQYILAQQTNDASILRRIFHPSARVQFISADTVAGVSINAFAGRFTGRAAVDPITATVLDVSLSQRGAVVRLEMLRPTGHVMDYLLLMKQATGWSIIAKATDFTPRDTVPK